MNSWISKHPKCEIVTATKELVDSLLAANTGNRRVRPTHRKFLREIIESGQFVLTNQGFGIDVDGVLIDGQHRLEALVAAGYPPVQILIVYGLPRGARAAIDLGITRTLSDLMHFAFDHPEATSVMIATTRIWGRINVTGRLYGRPSPHQVVEWYTTLLPALERVMTIPGAAKVPAPVLAAICNRLVAVSGDERPLDFLQQVMTGANLAIESPALRLRNYLATRRGATGGGNIQVERYNKTAAALDAFLDNRPVMRLHARPAARVAVAA